MRVLVLSHMFPKAGFPSSGIFVYEQVRQLVRLGCDVKVISPEPWVPPGMSRLVPRWKAYQKVSSGTRGSTDFEVMRPLYVRMPGKWFFPASGIAMATGSFFTVHRLARSWRFDLIHSHALLPDSLAALILRKRWSVPIVATAHGSDVNRYPYFDGLSFRLTQKVLTDLDALVTVSEALASACSSLGSTKVSPIICRNGYDETSFFPRDRWQARCELGLGMVEGPILLFAGNLAEVKGAHLLATIMEQVRAVIPTMTLAIVGDGPLEHLIRREVESKGLSGHVKFVGRQDHSLMPKWISAADLVVMPSLSEGFPTLVAETLACGRPIVASKVGGIPEVVSEDAGLLVPVYDTSAFASAVITALQRNWKTETVANVARGLSWEQNASTYLRLYRQLLDSAPK